MVPIPQTRVINAASHAPGSPEPWPRVLVVDDELQQAKVAAWFVIEIYPDAEVHLARDADEAIAEAHGFKPDLLLTDLRMPGLNGIELCRLVRQDPYLSKVKVIAMTGYCTPMNRREALEFGAEACLPKPIDPALWRRDLARVLGRGREAGPPQDWEWRG